MVVSVISAKGAMCVDGDTEFLTPEGKETDQGLPWRSCLTAGEVLDMVLSLNHDVVLETSKGGLGGKPARMPFDENGVCNGNHRFFVTGNCEKPVQGGPLGRIYGQEDCGGYCESRLCG